jgi:hypothetical protein
MVSAMRRRITFMLGLLLLVASGPPAAAAPTHGSRRSSQMPESAKAYYRSLWGIDIIGVKQVSSGAMIRFSYRITDPDKAKAIHDKAAAPKMIDQKTGAVLVIPSMEKIGQLRQSSTPESGRDYWMLFSNKGSQVKPGSRVDVVVGAFRAQGLVVQAD